MNHGEPESTTPVIATFTFRVGREERVYHEQSSTDAMEKANAWVREAGIAPTSFAWFDGRAPNSYYLAEYGVWD